jgi:hypothetical protein
VSAELQRVPSGRGDHLGQYRTPKGPMLTQERLGEVAWALDKMREARKVVDRLMDGEPDKQPRTERSVAIEKIVIEMERLEEELEALFA